MTPDQDKENHSRLLTLKRLVTENLEGFITAGMALAEIRDKKLYRYTHETFATFIEDNWSLKLRRAYQLIAAAAVAENVQHVAPTPNARQAVELSSLPKAVQVEAWTEAVATAPTSSTGEKQITAAHVAGVVGKHRKSRTKKRRAPKPIRLRVPGGIVIVEARSHEIDPAQLLTDALAKLQTVSKAA